MYPMQLTDEQSINSAIMLCETGAGMTFHATKWLFIHEYKKHKHNRSDKIDPVLSDVCSALRGGHVENPEALGTLADELTGGYGLEPGQEHIWLGNRSDLSYFWKKDDSGQNVPLERSQLDLITDDKLRDRVQSTLAQAQLEGKLEQYGDRYFLTDSGRNAILKPDFLRSRLEQEARFYGNAVEGLGELEKDRIDRKLEELGLTNRFTDCDRITLNKGKLYNAENEQSISFYVPYTKGKKQILIPRQDVIDLDENTYAAFLHRDAQYSISGKMTAEQDVFKLFNVRNKEQAAEIRATVAKAEAAAKAETELTGKKLFVLQNGIAKEHTVTRVWASPEGAHLHLQPADANAADLLLPQDAIGHIAFPTAAEATAYLEAHPQDVETYSALLREQDVRSDERIPSFTVSKDRIAAVGNGFEVQTNAPYERVVFDAREVRLLENGNAIITPENSIHTVRTGNVSYEVTGQGARELTEKAKRTAQKAADTAEKTTEKAVQKTAEAVTNAAANASAVVSTGAVGTVAKGAVKSVELMQYASKLADGTAEVPSRVARLVQKL